MNYIDLKSIRSELKTVALNWIQIEFDWNWIEMNIWNLSSIEIELNWIDSKLSWLSVWIYVSSKCYLGSAPEELIVVAAVAVVIVM